MRSEKDTVATSSSPMAATSDRPLRLVVVDASDDALPWRRARGGAHAPEADAPAAARREPSGEARSGRVGLAPIWSAGAYLYAITRTADAWLAARSWDEALDWCARLADERSRTIGSLQVWCHGGWGSVRLGQTRLDQAALAPDHPLAPRIDALRDRLTPDEALVWFRCCSAFGHHGRHFASSAADRFRCRVAGHTYIIHFFQSGLHSLAPGREPSWSEAEGVRMVDGNPATARSSSPRAPNTITCLRPTLPGGY